MTSFVFSTTHQVYYSNREPVPIREIVDSLLGLEQVIRMSPRVLHGLTGVEIDRVEIFVEHLETGSLMETVLIKLFFKSEDDLNAFLDKVRGKLEKPMARNILIGSVLTALVGYGAYLAATAQKGAATTTITANNNVIINLGAGQVDLTPEAFKAIVEAAVVDKKALANSAVKVLKPARLDSQASITFDESSGLVFPPDVVKATPKTVEIEVQQKVEHMLDVDLEIRATNLDSARSGWAALLPGKIDRRIKLELADGVSPIDVAGKLKVRADISIYYALDKDGVKLIPHHIMLRSVIK
ncbi:hypothetical protein [Zoogloea sp.]|uniref:hypothetical protein n=1 Tax=Zoogloea sp. TaxID=49181 RepID=UPI001AC08005|nr:hypothetical protein [Zoogloea sp.]MBN8283398.1 hypothetical protein [Zoogloea sp.]